MAGEAFFFLSRQFCVKIMFYLYSICILYCISAYCACVAIKNSRIILCIIL